MLCYPVYFNKEYDVLLISTLVKGKLTLVWNPGATQMALGQKGVFEYIKVWVSEIFEQDCMQVFLGTAQRCDCQKLSSGCVCVQKEGPTLPPCKRKDP